MYVINNRIEKVIQPNIIMTLTGHLDIVSKILYSSKKLVSCSDDTTIKIWDIESGSCLDTLHGHTEPINDICLLPDNKLASVCRGKTIKIWDLNSKILVKSIITDAVPICIIEKNFHLFITFASTGNIYVWNQETYEICNKINAHTNHINCLLVMDDILVSASDDKLIKLWCIFSGKYINHLKGHTERVICLKRTYDGNLVSGSTAEIKVWHEKTNCVATFNTFSESFEFVILFNRYIILDNCEMLQIIDIAKQKNGTIKRAKISSDCQTLTKLPTNNIAIGNKNDIIIIKPDFIEQL